MAAKISGVAAAYEEDFTLDRGRKGEMNPQMNPEAAREIQHKAEIFSEPSIGKKTGKLIVSAESEEENFSEQGEIGRAHV